MHSFEISTHQQQKLTVLKISSCVNNNDLVCCIADALSQNCSLTKL